MSATFNVVFMTAPNGEEASRIAEALVEENLVACVNLIDACQSVYRWKGEIVKDSEVLMIAKTTAENFPAIEERVTELHSYDVPEIIACDLTSLAGSYEEWLRNVIG